MIRYKNEFPNNLQQGQAMLVSVVFFLFASLAVTTGLVAPAVKDAGRVNEAMYGTASFFAAEAGSEDAVYRLKEGLETPSSWVLDTGSAQTTVTITDIGSNEKLVRSEGDALDRHRNIESEVTVGTGVSFSFGVQAGLGGFDIKNSASISGNAYSNGPITGANSNIITGDVVSAGAAGLIENVNVSGSAYAHAITNSDVGGDAYYDSNISGTSVTGTKYSGSSDQPIVDLPITDDMIDTWKSDAENGGVISCSGKHEIDDTVTLGPVKIECDLEITGNNYTVTLSGPVWVEGDIIIKNGPTVEVDSSLGSNSVVVIADNEADRDASSKIELKNSATFNGTGQAGSYIMFVSQNNSAENSTGVDAIVVKNSVSGDLLIYAGHGEVEIQNSVSLKEVTAHTITLKNTTQVIYETGLTNPVFSSDPSGAFVLKSWEEVE